MFNQVQSFLNIQQLKDTRTADPTFNGEVPGGVEKTPKDATIYVGITVNLVQKQNIVYNLGVSPILNNMETTIPASNRNIYHWYKCTMLPFLNKVANSSYFPN